MHTMDCFDPNCVQCKQAFEGQSSEKENQNKLQQSVDINQIQLDLHSASEEKAYWLETCSNIKGEIHFIINELIGTLRQRELDLCGQVEQEYSSQMAKIDQFTIQCFDNQLKGNRKNKKTCKTILNLYHDFDNLTHSLKKFGHIGYHDTPATIELSKKHETSKNLQDSGKTCLSDFNSKDAFVPYLAKKDASLSLASPLKVDTSERVLDYEDYERRKIDKTFLDVQRNNEPLFSEQYIKYTNSMPSHLRCLSCGKDKFKNHLEALRTGLKPNVCLSCIQNAKLSRNKAHFTSKECLGPNFKQDERLIKRVSIENMEPCLTQIGKMKMFCKAIKMADEFQNLDASKPEDKDLVSTEEIVKDSSSKVDYHTANESPKEVSKLKSEDAFVFEDKEAGKDSLSDEDDIEIISKSEVAGIQNEFYLPLPPKNRFKFNTKRIFPSLLPKKGDAKVLLESFYGPKNPLYSNSEYVQHLPKKSNPMLEDTTASAKEALSFFNEQADQDSSNECLDGFSDGGPSVALLSSFKKYLEKSPESEWLAPSPNSPEFWLSSGNGSNLHSCNFKIGKNLDEWLCSRNNQSQINVEVYHNWLSTNHTM